MFQAPFKILWSKDLASGSSLFVFQSASGWICEGLKLVHQSVNKQKLKKSTSQQVLFLLFSSGVKISKVEKVGKFLLSTEIKISEINLNILKFVFSGNFLTFGAKKKFSEVSRINLCSDFFVFVFF